jgi:hypothetical protein
MWKRVFSSPDLPALTAWDLKNKFGANKEKGIHHRVCFKEISIGTYGY